MYFMGRFQTEVGRNSECLISGLEKEKLIAFQALRFTTLNCTEGLGGSSVRKIEASYICHTASKKSKTAQDLFYGYICVP